MVFDDPSSIFAFLRQAGRFMLGSIPEADFLERRFTLAGLAFRIDDLNPRVPAAATGWVSVHKEVLHKGAHLRALTDPNAVGVGMIVSEAPALAFCGSRLVLEELAVTSDGHLDVYALAPGTLVWINIDRRLLDAAALDVIANLSVGLLRPEREALAELRAACAALFPGILRRP